MVMVVRGRDDSISMGSQEGPQEGEVRQVGKERWGRGWEVVVYEEGSYSSSNGLNPEGPRGVALSLVRARAKVWAMRDGSLRSV